MPVLFLVLLVIIILEASEMFRLPVGAIFGHGRLELAGLLGTGLQFQLKGAVNVDVIIGFVGGGVEKVEVGNYIRLEFVHEQMFRLPVGAIFGHGRLELADLLANGLQFQLKGAVNVDVIIGFVGGGVEKG